MHKPGNRYQCRVLANSGHRRQAARGRRRETTGMAAAYGVTGIVAAETVDTLRIAGIPANCGKSKTPETAVFCGILREPRLHGMQEVRGSSPGTHPNRRHLTFWDLLITGDDLGEATGWSNGRRRRADSSERLQRCRSGAGKTCTLRSTNNTRSSRISCGATTGIYGIIGNFASIQQFREGRERYGATGCLGVAEADD